MNYEEIPRSHAPSIFFLLCSDSAALLLRSWHFKNLQACYLNIKPSSSSRFCSADSKPLCWLRETAPSCMVRYCSVPSTLLSPDTSQPLRQRDTREGIPPEMGTPYTSRTRDKFPARCLRCCLPGCEFCWQRRESPEGPHPNPSTSTHSLLRQP